jgi:hypothetical protein
MLNDIGLSAANPLLSSFTPGAETNVFQQSNLTLCTRMNMKIYNKSRILLLLLLIQIAGLTTMKN